MRVMPHHKGRARDVVPHREHRSSKKAGQNKPESPALSYALSRAVIAFDLDSFAGVAPFPNELWSRVASHLGFVELCSCEMTAKCVWSSLAKETCLWQLLCALHFPAMAQSVVQNPVKSSFLLSPSLRKPQEETQLAGIDWKMLFARRWQKQLRWEGRGARASHDRVSRCAACGETLRDERAADECSVHSGDFLPLNTATWNRAELQQLQMYAHAAWRSIGGDVCHSAKCKDVSRWWALGQRIELQGLGIPRPLGGGIGYTPGLFESACMHRWSCALLLVLLWF